MEYNKIEFILNMKPSELTVVEKRRDEVEDMEEGKMKRVGGT